MAGADILHIEVAYARPERQRVLALEVPAGTSALEAVRLSGIAVEFPEIDLEQAAVGVFGRVCPAGEVLREGDRVEIYRPLVADPKEVRRARAAKARGA